MVFSLRGRAELGRRPTLFRLCYILTSPSELPTLPPSISTANPPRWMSYAPIHGYTVVQVAVTVVIFVVTLTKAAPAFPVLIIALVPVRLSLMSRIWRREALRFVDAWACKEGIPEDDEGDTARTLRNDDRGVWGFDRQNDMEMGVFERDRLRLETHGGRKMVRMHKNRLNNKQLSS
ncbi:hypothetical protein GJ744_008839 [Endocarpon pusillum]|uniref:Bicarbonate transporter-like transmembrane domain-containing protein n=1 Tax=Endocarpon pusillum TaxID=364733 RepID=A0A8H7AYN6_9EURO|nr:hypothetical protein GJ744_008839 [Endocarpon pusillum]